VTKPLKIGLLIAAGGIVIVVVLALWVRSAKNDFFYPEPPPAAAMPAVVPETMDELLAKLDAVLLAKAPAVAAALRTGLTDAQIDALEQQGGFKLTDELRALYRWHNGMPATGAGGTPAEFIPIHRFLPLDEAVQEHAIIRQQVQNLSLLQRAMHGTFAGHRDGWVTVFDDGAGDGYFYDPDRRDRPGHFFYSFAEDVSYEYFPSLRNFLAGVIECYESDVYYPAAGRPGLDADYAKAAAMWARYAAAANP
jgi:cell wall assembly regulator SMI1